MGHASLRLGWAFSKLDAAYLGRIKRRQAWKPLGKLDNCSARLDDQRHNAGRFNLSNLSV